MGRKTPTQSIFFGNPVPPTVILEKEGQLKTETGSSSSSRGSGSGSGSGNGSGSGSGSGSSSSSSSSSSSNRRVVFCAVVRPSLPPAPQRPWITFSEPVKNKPVGKDSGYWTCSCKRIGNLSLMQLQSL